MRQVSEVELKRLKKRGKVRRKLGAQPKTEKPEPVVAEGIRKSGSEPETQPVPASTPAPVEQSASMSASMALRDGLLEQLVSNNTAAIERFSLALAAEKPKRGVAYRHTVNRSKDKLIDFVDSIPMES
jgi:hypothetical protein